MEIIRQIQNDLRYTYGLGNPKKYLVIHQTGNPSKGANAAAHANLQSRLGIGYSWHWQVDEKQAIQSYLHEVRCWHIGDGRGPGNLTSIGIEICINSDGDYVGSVKNGAKLAAKILKEENISINNIVQHNYFKQTSGYHKNCPEQIRAGKAGITWNVFVNMVKDELNKLFVKSSIKSSNQVKNNTDQLYRVQVGAFNNKENADKLVKELENKGFKPFISTSKETPQRKTNEEVAKEVLEGKWGNNPERKKRLEAAGYKYLDIQAIVNRLA